MVPELSASDGPWARYRDYLRAMARVQLPAQLRGKLDPSDLVQQALLRAHEKQAQYRGRTPAEEAGWLRAILANTLAEAGRRFARQQRDVTREQSLEAALAESSARLEAWLAARDSSPSDAALRQEQQFRLAAALPRLPEDQRTALELRHFGGLAIAEIAREMGRSEIAVTGLIRRGLQRLRELLGEATDTNHD
jgi:RNA polymerase sigma-70 factor (ECF subfamily)